MGHKFSILRKTRFTLLQENNTDVFIAGQVIINNYQKMIM